MSTARDVYNAFKSHKERQEQILASVKKEQAEVVRAYEGSSDTLTATFVKLFPTLADLPLDVMQEASRLKKGGAERDYRHMVETLRAQDERNAREKAALVQQHGTLADIQRKGNTLDEQAVSLSQAIQLSEKSIKKVESDLRQSLYRREALKVHFKKSGLEITDKNATDYSDFRLGKWLVSSEWRQGRKALATFHKRGGQSIDDDVADFTKNQTALLDLQTLNDGRTTRHASTLQEKKNLQGVATKMAKLSADIMGEEKIHRTVCANFVDLLRDEEVARFVGQKLANDKAEPLMVETLKYRNLSAIYDNLETLRVQAEKALGQVSEPISKLKRLVSNAPSKQIKIDLADVSTQYGKFNKAAEDYVGRSQNMRGTLGNFSSTYSRPNAPVTVYTHDDSYQFMNLMLMNMMMQDNNTVHHAPPDAGLSGASLPDASTLNMPADASVFPIDVSSGLQGCTLPDAGLYMPDFGSSLSIPSCDLGSISIPSIDSGSFSSSYDSGGSSYSSFDTGSSSFDGGGGSFIIREDAPRRGFYMPSKASTLAYAEI